MKLMMILGMMILPAAAFAHGTKLEMTEEALKVAIPAFEKDYASRIADFAAVKAWPDGANIQVKFTLQNGSATDYAGYMCMEHENADGTETWMCHKN